MSTPAPTPQDHEARIAELRARRRARLRWLAVRAVLLAGVLTFGAALLLYWLLGTIGGRDVLLAQIVARLPPGTTLTWERAEGPAAGPLVLHGVRFSTPRQLDAGCVPTETAQCARGRIAFTARRVALDPALRPLLGRRLQLDALDIAGATLALPRDDTPFRFPRWPDALPDIAPPLALRAAAIRIDGLRVLRDGEALLDVRSARGGLDAARGALHVEHLRIDSDRGAFAVHGDYLPRARFRSDLVATAVLPAPPGRTRPRLGLVARGDLARMQVALAGTVPGPLRVQLQLRGADAPRWSLRARSEALDPALLAGSGEPSTPLAFDVQADGVGGQAALQGRLARGDLALVVRPSRVALHEEVLDVQPLVVDALGGRTTLRGQADLRDPRRGRLRFAVAARGLAWGGGAGTPAVRADADFGLAGRPAAWAATGNARLARERERARLRFDARGDTAQADIRALQVRMPGGTLDARGHARWSPRLQWDLAATLAGFDPGYFLPGWEGALQGRIASRGAVRDAGGVDASLDVPRLTGRLRGRALDGRGTFALHGRDLEGDLALALGGSRVQARGRIADRLAVEARFAPLQLADLLPRAGGTLQGTLRLGGTRSAPDIDADLFVHGLAYADYRVDRLRAQGRLPWRGGGGVLTMEAQGLAAGLAFEQVRVTARGAVEALQLQADARGAGGTVALAGSAARRGRAWQGTLASLRYAPARGAAWQLQSPAQYAQDGARWTLARSCFAAAGGGRLCVAGDWPRHGVELDGQGLPLALATPYLPERSDGRPWLLRGELAVRAQLRPVGHGWRGSAQVTSAGGGLKNSERARRELVAYDHLVLDANFDPQRLEARLRAGLIGNGHLDARLETGWDAYAPLRGEIALDTDALTWMELFSPDIVEPTGHLGGRITLAGTRAQPQLGGQAQLSGFATELPALAIAVSDGNVRLDALPDGSARIHGSLRLGEGTLALDGSLGWRNTGAQAAPLVLAVRGRNVLAADTRDVRAVIDPDVVVRYRAGEPLAITGTIGVPSARLDLERLDEGVSVSPDVVVLDPADPHRRVATPVTLDLTLALGDDVRLNGFGLEGTLAGDLRVRTRPGREARATGTLDVGGRYTAYGRKLDITRGRLVWSDSPFADPLLDIRAERDVGDVTAGIDVDGRASAPNATVWSDPPADQSEALAYLTLGRPLASASADESRQVDAASAALSAGGSLLASQLGTRLGLDTSGVTESRALGGSVLGVGKYLSPKLYVGYGVSLLGTGQVLTLKYLLRKGFDVEIESSTTENRASVNWRKEK